MNDELMFAFVTAIKTRMAPLEKSSSNTLKMLFWAEKVLSGLELQLRSVRVEMELALVVHRTNRNAEHAAHLEEKIKRLRLGP